MGHFAVIISSLLLIQGAAAQAASADCSSIGNAITSHANATKTSGPGKSISMFYQIMSGLGMDGSVVETLGSSNVFIPTDEAWTKFITEVAGPNVDPMSFILSRPNTFKQILLYLFTGELVGTSGLAYTGLAAHSRLTSFIDMSRVCGGTDSEYVKIQFEESTQPGTMNLTEPVGNHYTASTVTSVCSAPSVSVMTVDKVLTPCPHSETFPSGLTGEHGCMSIAQAASIIDPQHAFGTLPYDATSSPLVQELRHPNLLSSVDARYTVFVPSTAALQSSGVLEPAFVQTPGALVDVVRGHIAESFVCVGGQAPASVVNTLAGQSFCSRDKTLSISQASGTVEVAAGSISAAVTDMNNIRVCGGLLHVVDNVLLPCDASSYASAQSAAEQARVAEGASVASSASSIFGVAVLMIVGLVLFL